MTTHVRSRARSWALQVMYAWDLSTEEDLLGFSRRLLGQREVAERYRPYLRRLLEIVSARLGEIDRTLRDTIPNWRLERLAVIDRNVLRIGAAELLFSADVPGKVAISEAIKLAEKYGSEESPRFVNGVLDAVYRKTTIGS
ncbi:MAG: transcription antitermination factor NusB [Gemmatimonadota bacterium]